MYRILRPVAWRRAWASAWATRLGGRPGAPVRYRGRQLDARPASRQAAPRAHGGACGHRAHLARVCELDGGAGLPGRYETIASTPGAANAATARGVALPIASSGCPAGVNR